MIGRCTFIDYTGIPESWAIVGQDDQLGSPLTDHLLGLFVAQDVFSTLHHQLETRVDGLHRLFLNRHTAFQWQGKSCLLNYCPGYIKKEILRRWHEVTSTSNVMPHY